MSFPIFTLLLLGGMYGRGTSSSDPFLFFHTGFKSTKELDEVEAVLLNAPVLDVVVKLPKRKPPPPPPSSIEPISNLADPVPSGLEVENTLEISKPEILETDSVEVAYVFLNLLCSEHKIIT